MILSGRFDGTVLRLGAVNVTALSAWVSAIPFEDWPQQDRLRGELRPAMVNDRQWQGFGAVTDALVALILSTMTEGGVEIARMLSVLMPGHAIEPHVDKHAPRWWGRLHVPLTRAPASRFIVGGVAHHLAPGWAYLVNSAIEHSVDNLDTVPRVHFMLDVGHA